MAQNQLQTELLFPELQSALENADSEELEAICTALAVEDLAEMVRRLSIGEKLELSVPLLDQGRSTKGTEPWRRFVHLKRLRDELVHVKDRGYSKDPDQPSAYGQLMLGAGDNCVEDASSVVLAARPGFLPEHVLSALDIEP